MASEIKPLRTPKPKMPPLWTWFVDGADSNSFSMVRLLTFLVFIIFMPVWGYLCFHSGTFVVPPTEFLLFLMTMAGIKPVQRFAEVREVEAQLNADFQNAQLQANQASTQNKVDSAPKT